MDMDNQTIGKRLKKTRQNRNMTLDELAEVTGVSKPMLGQIERGQSSPTVTTLWKIATGMKIPFSSFLQEQGAEYTVVDLQERNVLIEENGAMKVYTLFAFDPIRSVEEYIFVIHGKLDIVLNGTEITLGEKQAVRFEANIPHSYMNPYKDTCNIYNFIFYTY